MSQYIEKTVSEEKNRIYLSFRIEQEKILAIGEKMNEINESAYMNGYNWEAFLNYYVGKYNADILTGMESDPEAGGYYAYWDYSPENEKRADELVAIIQNLIENEAILYKIVAEDGDEIEWD